MVSAIDLHSSHLPSQLPPLAEGKRPWDMLCHFRGLNRLLDPTLQHLWGMALKISHSHNAPWSFVNCLNCTIAFLQLIHQHSLLPVFRGCTLFFLLGYWWPFHSPLWPTLVCHSQIMEASIAWKNKFYLQVLPIKSSVSLDLETKSLSICPEHILQNAQLNVSTPLIFYALGFSFYI